MGLKALISSYLRSRYTGAPKEWILNDLPKIKALRNRYAGQSCFLLANGPSLNRVNFDALKGLPLIGMNKIHLMLDRHTFQLIAHVAVNEHVIKQCWRDFEKLNCPSFLQRLPEGEVSRSKNTIFIRANKGLPGFYNIQDSFWPGHTVTYVSLQIAYYLGFTNVFLVGLDHYFEAKGNPNELQTLKGSDPNHFDPRYFENMPWQLPDMEASEMAYRIADFTFRRSGRKIYDATEGGRCDIFEKILFDEAVQKCRQTV